MLLDLQVGEQNVASCMSEHCPRQRAPHWEFSHSVLQEDGQVLSSGEKNSINDNEFTWIRLTENERQEMGGSALPYYQSACSVPSLLRA